MQKILSRVRRAVEKYGMIKKGDKICVGVSGGKDSLVLLSALAHMRRFDDFSYEIEAVTIDNGIYGAGDDTFSSVRKFCEKLDVNYTVIKTEIGKIIFEERKEENPCSLCAKLRRGALHNAAIDLGCTALALGHHLDDVCETYMMNIILTGRAGCFCPSMEYENSGVTLIRPMIYLREGEITSCATRQNMPVMTKTCPIDGLTERHHFKALLREEDRRHRGVYTRILGALERSGVDSWHE